MQTDDCALQTGEPHARAALAAQLRELVERDAKLAREAAETLLAATPPHERSSRALSLCVVGIAELAAGRYAGAQEALSQALALTSEQESLELRADILNQLAICSYHQDHFEDAMATGLEGLSLSRAAGARLLEAAALHTIGWVYHNFGLYQDALESFLAELAILSERETEGVRRALSLAGASVAYSRLQEFGKAMTYLESALALARQQGDARAQAFSLSILGLVVDERREYGRALEYYRESLAFYRELDDPLELARLYTLIGEAERKLGRLAAAQEAFSSAFEALERQPSASNAIELHLALCYLNYQKLDSAQALEHLYAARALTDEDAAPADAYRVQRALAEAYKMQGDFRRALAHFETFHALKERVQREAELRKAKGQLLHFDVERLQHEREMFRLKHVELARAYSQLEALSVRDPLTQLYNRHHLNQQLAREVTRAQRYGRPLSLMFCDIDDFKGVNDRFSHAVGDQVLRVVADILMKRTRAADVRARYGGEELVVIFSETDLESAVAICQKIRRTVERYDWRSVRDGLAVTLSLGVAELREGDTPESLMARADEKLYEAKRAGKNRVAS